jgi:hypothetical protein
MKDHHFFMSHDQFYFNIVVLFGFTSHQPTYIIFKPGLNCCVHHWIYLRLLRISLDLLESKMSFSLKFWPYKKLRLDKGHT